MTSRKPLYAELLLYKTGSRDNFGNYRAIGLLCHSYKLLSMLVQHRMQDAVESQLAEILAGFGRARGCRDKVLVLRLLMEVVPRAGGQAVVTFIPRCLQHHQPPLSGRVRGSRQSVAQCAPHSEGHLRCDNGYGAAAPTEWRDDMFGAVSHQARRHPGRYIQPTVLHARAGPHLPTARHRGLGHRRPFARRRHGQRA